MNPLQKRVEGEIAVKGNDDFTIENETRGADGAKCGDEFGKIAREELTTFRFEVDAVAIAKRDAAEAVPLRFVMPVRARRQLGSGIGFHRRVFFGERESHRGLARSVRPR